MANDKDFQVKNDLNVQGGKIWLNDTPASSGNQQYATIDGSNGADLILSSDSLISFFESDGTTRRVVFDVNDNKYSFGDSSSQGTTDTQDETFHVSGSGRFTSSLNVDGSILGRVSSEGSATADSGNSHSFVNNVFLNPSPEAGGAIDIRTVNELAGLNTWGTISAVSGFYTTRTNAGSAESPNFSYSNQVTSITDGNMFDGVASIAGSWFTDNGTDGTTAGTGTFTLGFAGKKELDYTCYVGIVFGSSGFTAKKVKIEVYRGGTYANDAYSGGTWTTICDLTNNSALNVSRRVQNNSSNGVQQIKYTLGGVNTTSSTYFRVQDVYALDHDAGGNAGPKGIHYVRRYGDSDIYGNLLPATDSTYTLGDSDQFFSGVYSDKIYLNDTADTTATDKSALFLDGTEVKKRTLGSAAFSATSDFLASDGTATTATTATNVTVTANNSTDETNFLTFGAGGANSGNLGLETDTSLKYNPSTNVLTAGTFKGEGTVHYVEGNTSGTAGTWTGSNTNIGSYYNGLIVAFKHGIAGASTTTLNINSLGAKTVYRYNSAKLTTHIPVGTTVNYVYDSSSDAFFAMTDIDNTLQYELRWASHITAGATIHGRQLIMEGSDGKFYPVTSGGANANTNTVSTQTMRMGGLLLLYESATDIAADAVWAADVWESRETNHLEYWTNHPTSEGAWGTAGGPLYLVGTEDANGHFVLDNTNATSFLAQALPSSDDGKIYIHLGYFGDTTNTDNLRFTINNPMYQYINGQVQPYTAVPRKVTVTDNESTNENNLIPFVAGAATATGDHGLEMDGDFTYNPSTGRVVATKLSAGASAGSTNADIELSQNAGATLLFHSTDTTVAANQELGKIHFKSSDASNTDGQEVQAEIKAIAHSTSGGGQLVFSTQDDASGDNNDDLVEAMRINEHGKVGIGDNDPSYTLHVTDSSSSGHVMIESTHNSTSQIRFKAATSTQDSRIGCFQDAFQIITNNANNFWFTSGGRLGVGQTGQNGVDSPLHIESADDVLAKFQSSDGTAQIICVDNSGSAGIGAVGDTLHLNPAGTSKATLNTSGVFTTTRATLQDSTSNGPRLSLELTDADPEDNDIIAGIDFRAKNSDGSGALQYASIEGGIIDETAGEIDGQLLFRVTKANSSTNTPLILKGDQAEFGLNEVRAGSLHLRSSDAGTGEGPDLTLLRDSASPDTGDSIGAIRFKANNSNGDEIEYAKIVGLLADHTDNSEDININVHQMVGGTMGQVLNLRSSNLTIMNPTDSTIKTVLFTSGITFVPGDTITTQRDNDQSFTFQMRNFDATSSVFRFGDETQLAAYGLRILPLASSISQIGELIVGHRATGNIYFANIDKMNGKANSGYQIDLRYGGDISKIPHGLVLGSTADSPELLPYANGTGNIGSPTADWNLGYFNTIYTSTLNTSILNVANYMTLADSDSIRFGNTSGGDARFFYDGSNNDFELELESGCTDFLITDNGTTRFTFTKSTGAFTATGNITAFSDARLKTDVKTLDPSKTLQMRGVEFIKDGEKGSGVIAQELEKVAPELVLDGKDGYKSVAYGNLTGYLIETVKEQQKQIDELKELVQKLLEK